MTTTGCVGIGYNVYKVKLYSSNTAMATHWLIVIIITSKNWDHTGLQHIWNTDLFIAYSSLSMAPV